MKKTMTVLLSSVMCLSLLAGCGGNASSSQSGSASGTSESSAATVAPAAERDSDGTVYLGTTNTRTVGHFDVSGLLSDDYCQPSVYLVFDPLLYMHDGEYISDILDDFYWDDDLGYNGGTVLVLKDGVTFANGDPLTADDVFYSISRCAQVPRMAGNMSMLDLDNATVSDDGLTISIPWTTPYAAWKLILSSVCPFDEQYIEDNGGDNFDWTDPELANGTGPYRVSDVEGETSITFEKRDDWWNKDAADEATVDTIVLTSYSDDNTMMVDYETGVLDGVINITSTDYDYVNDDPSLGTAIKTSTNSVATLVLDVDNCEELQNEKLREALSYAIDGSSVATLAYGSLYEPAEGFLATSSPCFVEGYNYTYDPDKAKEIIEENGLSGTELEWVCVSGSQATIAEAIQSELDEVGITLNLDVYDAQTCVQKWLEEGSTDMMLDQASNSNSGNQPSVAYMNMVDTTDFPCMRKTNTEWNELLDEAFAATDEEEQKNLYEKIQQFEHDNYYAIPICEWDTAYAYGSTGVITDMQIEDCAGPNLRYITIK